MAYIDTVALNITGRMLSRTVTDMWRGGRHELPAEELSKAIDSEIQSKIGNALDSTVTDLREAVWTELEAVARISGMVRIRRRSLLTTPPGKEGAPDGTVRVIADKKEMHRVLVKISASVAGRRKARRAA